MIKIRKRTMLLLLCSICLTGCRGERKLKINAEEITKDTIASCNDEVFYEYMNSYPDIASLARDSDAIVYGKTEGIRYYIDWNGICHTKADIKILQSFQGNYKEGTQIKIVKDQGYVSVKDYMDALRSKEEKKSCRRIYEHYSDEALEHIYMQQTEKDDIMLETNQKSVYFLQRSAYYNTDGTYARINGPEGEYIEIDDDCFINVKTFCDYQNSAEMQENTDFEDTECELFTLDEIASQIHASK